MKKLLCFIAVMLVAGAVVANEYFTVRVNNKSSVDLDLGVSLALFDETTPTRGTYYLPSKEHDPKKVGAGEICETKFIKPCIPIGVNPSNCKMEFSIQYGESTLHRCQFSKQFEVTLDPVASTDRERLTGYYWQ
jgi:hypothetical protein